MTELPICAALLARETGLPEPKAVSLIEEMRRSGMAVMHNDEEMNAGLPVPRVRGGLCRRGGEESMNRTYWVIEFAGNHPRIEGVVNYACIRDVDDPTKQGFMDWTDNIADAIQFARKVDAERFTRVYWFSQSEDIRICEYKDTLVRTRLWLGHEGADA